ncbi:MAG: D-alanine--D-alanine ligase [candidate division KSB1 bacterium]|nr:D-alanine--D-alanine ligase [candidate division KSB1 bacterium]MDZ7341580.1 D-alanine--D-alanine ligase [candidate division KSB1 bacterium]
MKIAVVYSSKEGLLQEYQKYHRQSAKEIPADFFAEGDSFETIHAVMDAVRWGGHEVVGLEGNDQVASELENSRPDLVFNMTEGLFGDFRESYVPMICERLGLPYTGSDPLTLALCLNKARTKEVLGFYAITTPHFKVMAPGQQIELAGIQFPAIIKPVAEGSSKGVFDNSVVENEAEALDRIEESFLKYNQAVLIEEFLTGSEFTVAIWGNGSEVEVLPIVALNYDQLPAGAKPIYSYEAKWIWDRPDAPLEIFACPAPISKALREKIELLVRRAYDVLAVRDWCRTDVRLDAQGNPHILELNPLPGILPKPEDNSCFPKAARTAGYSYEEMINHVIDIASKRYGL